MIMFFTIDQSNAREYIGSVTASSHINADGRDCTVDTYSEMRHPLPRPDALHAVPRHLRDTQPHLTHTPIAIAAFHTSARHTCRLAAADLALQSFTVLAYPLVFRIFRVKT